MLERKKKPRRRPRSKAHACQRTSAYGNRETAIAKIRRGLEHIAHVVWRAHPNTDLATIPARVTKLLHGG